MSSETTPLVSPPRGTYVRAGPNDKRSPCPLVNSLANHGYIPRTGTSITAKELNAAMSEVGMSAALGAVFARPIFNPHYDLKTARLQERKGFLSRLWSIVCNPWSLLSVFGLRRANQQNENGVPVLDLDQLAIPGVVEHDVSLTRRDHQQSAGNIAPQRDLINDLLASSKDGKTITMEDLAGFRKRRIRQQLDDNPGLRYGSQQHQIACSEIALVLGLFGDGKSISCERARAFFQEERLPVKEGWKKRWWWTLGFVELARSASKVKKLIGLNV